MRKALIVLGALAIPWVLIAVTNLTGQWSLELRPDFSGNNDTVACSFLQDGEKLTLNCGSGPSITGDVKGRTVTFHFTTGRNNEALATYTGELDERETTISGKWHLTGDEAPREGDFLAKKTSDK